MEKVRKALVSSLIVAAIIGVMVAPAFAKKYVLILHGVDEKGIKSIEGELKKVNGVKSVSVQVVDEVKKIGKAEVECDETTSKDKLVEAVSKAGVKVEVQEPSPSQ